MIVLFSVNNECDFGVLAVFLQRLRAWLLSGEINCRSARKTFLFVGFWGFLYVVFLCGFFFFSWTNRLLLNLLFLLYLCVKTLEQDGGNALL